MPNKEDKLDSLLKDKKLDSLLKNNKATIANPRGPQGPIGLSGNDGSIGPVGPAGDDGATGKAGASGTSGKDGKDGMTGPSGPSGTDGKAGVDGKDGKAGKDGKSGAAGASGGAPAGYRPLVNAVRTHNNDTTTHFTMLDEDDMSSDDDTQAATQQSIKAFVEAQVAGKDEFTELTDTPSNFTGDGLKVLRVNTGETAVEFLDISTTEVDEGTNLYFTDERAEDAVGGILVDTASINFTYTDATPSITADVLPAGVDHDLLLNFTSTEHFTMLDEDDLSSDSATQAATQQSIKAYVDTNFQNYVTFTADLTLTDALHSGVTIINTKGTNARVEVLVDPVDLDATFIAKYVQESNTERTFFVVPSGKVINGVTNGEFRASVGINGEVTITVRDGKAWVRGNITKTAP